jgi:hypothetical protein
MKKTLLAAIGGLTLGVGVLALADDVHTWQDLESVHQHVFDAVQELQRVRAANHYDMTGHAKKAEDLLHEAEKELHAAVESAKTGH